jgi:hypothetical protein
VVVAETLGKPMAKRVDRCAMTCLGVAGSLGLSPIGRRNAQSCHCSPESCDYRKLFLKHGLSNGNDMLQVG